MVTVALITRRRSPNERLVDFSGQRTAIAVARELWPVFKEQRRQVIEFDKWYRNRLDEYQQPAVPPTNNEHHVALRDKSASGYARLVVGTVSQALYAEGLRTEGDRDNSPLWKTWQQNGMDAGQVPLHRAALAHGAAFTHLRRETSRLTGEEYVKIRRRSAKKMMAVFEEDDDQHPRFALDAEPQKQADGSLEWFITLFPDDEHEVYLSLKDGGSEDGFEFIEARRHGLQVPPVVRYTCAVDLDGNVDSEISPFIPLFGRIDQDTFDRLVVQRWGAHKVRFASGIEKPTVDEEARAAAAQLRAGDLLIASDPQARFGTLDASSLDGYISSKDADLRDLGAVTQTPPHQLLGQMVNVSAEALAAAEASLMRKVDERQHSFGESHEMSLRLGGYLGSPEMQKAAQDFSAQLRWKDTESRSLAQVADALAKVAGSLGIPVEMLWERLPGWTDQDTADARVLIEEQIAREMLLAETQNASQREVNGGGNSSGGQSQLGAPVGAGAAG